MRGHVSLSVRQEFPNSVKSCSLLIQLTENMDTNGLKTTNHADSRMETVVLGTQQYVRDAKGTWRYADSWIEVPGARDMTLIDRFDPKLVMSSGGQDGRIERVVVSGKSISSHPDLLGWCLDEGTPVIGPEGELQEILVPYEIWQEHDHVPGEVNAPENNVDPVKRKLALAEREYRVADRRLKRAVARRAEILRRYADKITREQARAITNLSVGRIQQLIREVVDDDLDEVDILLLTTVAARKPKGLKALHDFTSEESGIVYPSELIKRRVLDLVDRGLLLNHRGKAISITLEGHAVLATSSGGRRAASGDD